MGMRIVESQSLRDGSYNVAEFPKKWKWKWIHSYWQAVFDFVVHLQSLAPTEICLQAVKGRLL